MSLLENYFEKFKKNTIGYNQKFLSPYGEKDLIYADWVASGRLYRPIEEHIINEIGPFVANTHTETSTTGTLMTKAYHEAQRIIKSHVNAANYDVIITAGFGMTTVVNKFQRILGLKIPEQLKNKLELKKDDKPVVFITHMEHHSNQTSWLETICDVVVIEPTHDGRINLEHYKELLNLYKNRKLKIASITACSNVTGVETPYHEMAKLIHQQGGLCFVDFAASAPYVDINMHPEDPQEKLDAIFFSPHKFLGGPGTSGVLIFDSKLYNRSVPDHPGGGTVDWTNPWGDHKYINDIETREDGGTPGFLQAIKTALSIKLKNQMGVENIINREKELLAYAFPRFDKIPSVHLLADNIRERLGILSFYIEDLHYNMAVKLLNDLYGIQVRGGCSCAGTYGHYLLHVDPSRSKRITKKISEGDLSEKPGWVRLSLHPTMTDKELEVIMDAIEDVATNFKKYENDYTYSNHTNEFYHKKTDNQFDIVNKWFEF